MFKIKDIKDNKSQNAMNIDNPLFNYIKPENNDMFSKMSGVDLQSLFYYMENYYLELRNYLGFEDYITFGMELELGKVKMKKLKKRLEMMISCNNWSLSGLGAPYMGDEIISPILKDTMSSWNELRTVCSLTENAAKIVSNCGGHIHVGTQVIGEKATSWLNFIKLWSVYENIIYRFAYGEFLTARSVINVYAYPVSKIFWKDYQTMKECSQISTKDIIETISHGRYQAVNFLNVDDYNKISTKNTIEFRCPNGTVNPIIWQNNVNFFVNILLYSKSSRYDDDIVQNRKNINEDKYSDLIWYDEIYLDQALELCDMLFQNNFDKVYFLRQYLKSFETSNKEMSKSKVFTKKINN